MDSATTLVGLHEGSGQPSSSLRNRQGGSSGRDYSSASSAAPSSSSSSSLIKTARKARAWTVRSHTWQLMTIAALITAGWTFYFVTATPSGYSDYSLAPIQKRMLSDILGWAHVVGGGTAMALGPIQFLASLRRTGKHPDPRNSVHSWIGRVYMLCVLASGVGSLRVVFKADLYIWGTWGFFSLGVAWIVTASLGWAAMYKKDGKPDIAAHRMWMTQNFALTYAAVMLRWELPILLAYGWPIKFALSFTGWLCWVPNCIFVALI